jgi:hypothetical protein
MAPFRLTLVALGSLAYCGKALGCGGPDIEVPPTLDYYLQRLPAKSIVEVLNESGLTPKLGTQSVIDQGELETAFAAGPSPQLVAKIDDLLKKARQNYTGPEDVNLLQDFRDLAAGAGMPAEVEDYVKWRFSHRDLFVG